MIDLSTTHQPTWCPGCGDWGIWASLKLAITNSGLPTHQIVVVYDIGCNGNMSGTIKTYGFHGLHGRAIPAAAGIKLANHHLKVIVIGGDGGLLGEGLSHFVHACRANHDLTVIMHNNQTYGLTTGQSSPTSQTGSKGKATPLGVIDHQIDPVSLALISGASHVVRGFASDIPTNAAHIGQALNHPGLSFLEILQPCVTFNKTNTYSWFRSRLKTLSAIPGSLPAAIESATWSESSINQGIFKQDPQSVPFHAHFDLLEKQTLIQNQAPRNLTSLLKSQI